MKIRALAPRVASLPAPAPPDRRRGQWLMDRNADYLARFPFCACGCGRLADEVDHVVALVDGGEDAEPNLQGLAKECHAEKTRREAAGRTGGGRSGGV